MNAPVKLSWPATKSFWEIPVLFEDEHLLALDKPGGLAVAPDHDNLERPSLMRLMHDGITAAKPWASERQLTYLNHAHRLDDEASGILLLAKNKTVFMALADQFSAEKPVRKNLALAWGSPMDKKFEVDAKLSQHPLKPELMTVDSRTGKKAHTKFEVLEQFSDWCLLACSPLTDRKHQLRVHLKYAGFPVVADEIYGGKKLWLSRLKKDFYLKPGREERPLIGCAALHGEELSLSHPVTHEPLTIQCEWPKDLKVAVKYLRQYATGFSRDSENHE